jgi:hypothetical protein
MLTNSSLATNPSIEPRPVRSCQNIIQPTQQLKEEIRHFFMSYEQWRKFFDRDTYNLSKDWTNLLIPHLVDIGITCTLIFDYKHIRKKYSRKRRGKLITCIGHCKRQKCPVVVKVYVDDQSMKKHSPRLFTVHIIGERHHDPKTETASRPVTGLAREEMGITTALSSRYYF